MNKSELIAAVSQYSELTRKDAEKAVNAFTMAIADSLKSGEKVQIVGFGTFSAKHRPARMARNPRTGAEIKIKASRAPAFKVGKALKDHVNS
jgi:DNA-binding protein HU-beta